ncbi:hypothetical protein CSUI_003369 [Cystoisospora suis]|uniref:Transmembrane protein n=1 Tax=Cystoisospora suis TaxID=483139 RepID=A0A2C6L2T6_9APIC|nr:hypothetical protein CSUI_003369 [Cystoisospora suis]
MFEKHLFFFVSPKGTDDNKTTVRRILSASILYSVGFFLLTLLHMILEREYFFLVSLLESSSHDRNLPQGKKKQRRKKERKKRARGYRGRRRHLGESVRASQPMERKVLER